MRGRARPHAGLVEQPALNETQDARSLFETDARLESSLRCPLKTRVQRGSSVAPGMSGQTVGQLIDSSIRETVKGATASMSTSAAYGDLSQYPVAESVR